MIPATALTDPAIHQQSIIALSDSTIAPCAPANSGSLTIPADSSLLLYASGTQDTQGKLYPGVLFCPGAGGVAQPRPMLPNSGNVALSFTFAMTADSVANGNVQETDILVVRDGWMYNLSLQRVLASGEIDIIVDGIWKDTGLRVLPAPDAEHTVQIVYAIDDVAHTGSVVAFLCDGTTHAVPAALQKQPATSCTWLATVDGSDGAVYVQLQIGLMPAGEPVAIRYGALSLRYW